MVQLSLDYREDCINYGHDGTCRKDGEYCTPEQAEECAHEFGEWMADGRNEQYD